MCLLIVKGESAASAIVEVDQLVYRLKLVRGLKAEPAICVADERDMHWDVLDCHWL